MIYKYKHILMFAVLSLMLGFNLIGQLNIVDLSKIKLPPKVIKYDTTFFLPSFFTDKEPILYGMRGQNLIFLSSPFQTSLLKNGIVLSSYSDELIKHLNKPLKIVDIIDSKILFIENTDSILYKPDLLDIVVVESGYNKFLKKNTGKRYFVNRKESKFMPFFGNTIALTQGKPIFLKNLQLAKISELNDFAFIYTFQYEGKEFKMKKDFTFFESISSGIDGLETFIGDSFQNVDFMNENLYQKVENSPFKGNIYNTKISVGMNEIEVRLSWGSPSKVRNSNGFDRVWLYEQDDISFIWVYFKKGKVVKIIK